MSKERLEEIKTWLNRGFDLTEEDIEWLIEQAERAEKNAQDLEDMDRQLYSEQQQNKRYREAIEVAIRNMAASDNLGVKFALGVLEQALEGEE